MNETKGLSHLAAILALLPILSCGGSNSFTPTPAATPIPTPTPTPTPAPAATIQCPPLAGVKAYVHLNVGPGEQVLPDNPLGGVIGGRMVLDSTPLFMVDGRAVPCNVEHPNCGLPGPQCEDPRGAVWQELSGDYGWYPDLDPGDFDGDSSFAIRIPHPNQGFFRHAGQAVYQVCPRGDYAAPNAIIDTTSARCGKITVEVK